MKPLVILTRPEGQAGEVEQRIAALGFPTLDLPAFRIGPTPDTDALDVALEALGSHDLAVFVSPNAVRAVAARLHAPWPGNVVIGVMGPASEAAVTAAGWRASVIAPRDRHDSEALFQRLSGEDVPRRRVLIFRGDGGREWLRDALAAEGSEVTLVESYRRLPLSATPELAARLKALADGAAPAIVVLTSSEAARHLTQVIDGLGLAHWWRRQPVLASHPRIAEIATALGFVDVKPIASGDDGLLRALESLH